MYGISLKQLPSWGYLPIVIAMLVCPLAAAGPQRNDSYDYSTDSTKKLWMLRGMDSVKARLKDPDSAKFRDVFYHYEPALAPVTCGLVNAKNSFGAYAGFERFVTGGKVEATYLESDGADFDELWQKACLGGSGGIGRKNRVAIEDEIADFLGNSGGVGAAKAPAVSQLVLDIQKSLNRLGYEAGPEDGILGPRTRSAIREFEQGHGLNPTGEPSHSLLARVNAVESDPIKRAVGDVVAAWRADIQAESDAVKRAVGGSKRSEGAVAELRRPAAEPHGVALPVPSDPNSRYRVLEVVRLSADLLDVTTRRDGPSGISYSKRQVNCVRHTFRYVADADTYEDLLRMAWDGPMDHLCCGSISEYVARYACSVR